jgi:hypothetical protein
MKTQTITIPSADHGFQEGAVKVVVYDADTPAHRVPLDDSAIHVDPETHDVTVTLADGITLPLHPSDLR